VEMRVLSIEYWQRVRCGASASARGVLDVGGDGDAEAVVDNDPMNVRRLLRETGMSSRFIFTSSLRAAQRNTGQICRWKT